LVVIDRGYEASTDTPNRSLINEEFAMD
jgi:hypothetical protein